MTYSVVLLNSVDPLSLCTTVNRFLAKSYRDAMQGIQLKGSVSYLSDRCDERSSLSSSSIDTSLTVGSLIDAYSHRAARLDFRVLLQL